FLVAAAVGATLSLAEAALAETALATEAAAHPLGQRGAVAGVGGHEDLVAGGNRAGGARTGEFDFPEDVLLGPLHRQILVVGDSALVTAEPRPVVCEERTEK